MDWNQIEEILSSGNADIILKCGDVKVRPTHQEGRVVMRIYHSELSLFEPIRSRSYGDTDKIVGQMKDIEADSSRWIRL